MKKVLEFTGMLLLSSIAFGLVGTKEQGREIPGVRYSGGCGNSVNIKGVLAPDTKGRTVLLFLSDLTNYSVSSLYTCDLGESWSKPSPVVFGSDTATSAALVADSTGNIYMSFVHINRGISFCSSSDGGNTWSAPKRIVDRAVSPAIPQSCYMSYGDGNLYLAWTDHRDTYMKSKIYFISSSDKGNTWSEPSLLMPDTASAMPAALAAKGQEVGVLTKNLYHSDPDMPWDTVTARLVMITSTHAGQTWGPERYPDGEKPKTKALNDLYTNLDLERGADAYYALWDSSTTFCFASSTDRGLTWKEKNLFTADSTISKKYSAEIAARDNLVAVLICADGNTYIAHSTDCGETWTKLLTIGESQDPTQGTTSPNLVIDNLMRIHAVWTQNCLDSINPGGYWAAFYFCDTSAAIPGVVEQPEEFSRLITATPNPFSTKISLEISLDPSEMTEPRIYDASGRLIASFGTLNPGKGIVKISWDGRGENGTTLPSGSYFLKVHGGGKGKLLKIVKLR